MRAWILVVVLCGCAGTESLTSVKDDAGVRGRADAGDDADRLQREAEFWDIVAICGESVEAYPRVAEMADGADAVVVGRIVGTAVGNTIQGGAAEDFYAEVNLRIEVEETLRHTIDDSFALSLVLPRVWTREALEPAITAMQARLPQESIVFLVRKRTDLDFDDLYRLVNDKALWARTARSALDNPIAESRCLDHFGDEIREQFLGNVSSVEQLIENLRP